MPLAVGELLEETCFDCHTGKSPKAGFDLGRLSRLEEREWLGAVLHVRDRVESREMPPVDYGELLPDEVELLLGWAESRLAAGIGALAFDPGRVTIRRLSRVEYDNALRDLFRVSTDESARFPAENLGYGFDNIGDAASFSALHIEKYLAAASDVAAKVVDLADPDNPEVRRVQGADMEVLHGRGGARGDAVKLVTNGTVRARFTVPRSGRYRLTVVASGDQAGDEPVRIGLAVGRSRLDSIAVDATPRQSSRHTFEVDVDGAATFVDAEFLNDYYDPKHPNRRRRDRNMIVEAVELCGPIDERVPDGSQWVLGSDPGLETARRVRFVAIAEAVATRVWRRTPSDQDVARLAALAEGVCDAGGSFRRGARAIVEASLVSPRFLFRIEKAGDRALDGFELASRLSFFLWSSVPDDELLGLARSGQLRDDAVRIAQVRRMLRDPRASALATTFAAQWLELRNLETAEPDPARFPMSAKLRRAMQRETELVFETVLREGRSIYELCDADFTFVDESLAAHYGIEGVRGDEMQRVRAPRPGGVLGHASVLTVTSNPTRTSPVKRGKWVLENLLGAPPPPPEPGADSFEDEHAAEAPASMREQLARHRADPKCSVCHTRMDGLGLALERFDAIGRRRESDAGATIDASGVLPGGREIEDLDGIRDVVRGHPAFLRCVVQKLFVFAIGREPTLDDRLALERMQRGLSGEATTLEDIVVAITRLDAFIHTRSRPR